MKVLKYRPYQILIAILVVCAFLRFYKLPELATFDFDQEYAANFAYSIIHDHKHLFIGQELSVPGLFMGPWYFYYLTPFFALSALHPIGGYIGSGILTLAVIVSYFIVGREFFGEKIALLLAFMRAVSFKETVWSMVPAFHSELVVLWTWYLFFKYWQGKTNYLPLLGLAFGLYTSIHPILFPFYLVFVCLIIIKRKLPNLITLLKTLVFFIIPILPLLNFEYYHSFLEVKTLFNFFTRSGGSFSLNTQLSLLNNLFLAEPNKILRWEFLPPLVAPLIMLAMLVYLIVKKTGFWKNPFHKTLLLISFVIFIIYNAFFPSHVPEYYYLALSTLIFLYLFASLGLLLETIYFPGLIFVLLITLVGNLKYFVNAWNYPSHSNLYQKDAIVKEIIKRQKGQPCYVAYITAPGWQFGFNYLFKLYSNVPKTDIGSLPIYTIVDPKSLSEKAVNISSGNIGLILPK